MFEHPDITYSIYRAESDALDRRIEQRRMIRERTADDAPRPRLLARIFSPRPSGSAHASASEDLRSRPCVEQSARIAAAR